MPSVSFPKSVKPSDSIGILPVTSFADAKGHSFAVSTTSAREALDTTGYTCITIVSVGCDSLIRLGASDVVAATTDQGFTAMCPNGFPIDITLDNVNTQTHIAAIATADSGVLYITYRK